MTPKQAAEYRSKAKGIDPMTVYNALKLDSQRTAISRILSARRNAEKNKMYATWDYSVILPRREKVPGTLGYASEMKSITVILKRQPKSDPYVDMPVNMMSGGQQFMPNQQNFSGHMQGMPKEKMQQQHMNMNGMGPHNLPPPPNLPAGIEPVPRPLNDMHDPRMNGQMRNQKIPVPPHHGQPPMNVPGHMHPKAMHGARNSRDHFDRPGGFVESDSVVSEESDFSDRGRRSRNASKPRRGSSSQPPRPPMDRVHGGGARHGSRPGSPILKKKTSVRDITTPHGEHRRTKNTTTTYGRARSDSGSSDSSYDKMSDFSHRSNSTKFTDYSRSSFEDERYRRSRNTDQLRKEYDPRYERRMRSRDRRGTDRPGRYQDPYRVSKESLRHREHRLPSPFRGLSPARDSDSDRDQRPIIVHNHIHNGGPNTRRASPSGSSTASLFGSAYPGPRQTIQYPDPYDFTGLDANLPHAPMAPVNTAYANAASSRHSRHLKEQQRRRELQAEAYMQEEEKRAHDAAKIQKAFERGRQLERQTATNALFDDPIERGNRQRFAKREWSDIDWSNDLPKRSSRHRIVDDLDPHYRQSGYGNAGSSRNSFVDTYDNVRYGDAAYTMRGARQPLYP